MMLEVIWRKIKDKMYTAQKKIMISFSLRQIPPTKRIKAFHIRKYRVDHEFMDDYKVVLIKNQRWYSKKAKVIER